MKRWLVLAGLTIASAMAIACGRATTMPTPTHSSKSTPSPTFTPPPTPTPAPPTPTFTPAAPSPQSPTPTLTRTFPSPDTLTSIPTPTPTPPTTPTRELALSVLDRECTASHTAKIPSSPGLLCNVEAPNLAVYSDGLVLYHVWERKYYGSQIGGELHLGQMTPEELDDFLNRFEDAGVFSVQGPSDAEGDAPFYFIFAKFGGNNVSLVLNLMTLSMPEAQE